MSINATNHFNKDTLNESLDKIDWIKSMFLINKYSSLLGSADAEKRNQRASAVLSEQASLSYDDRHNIPAWKSAYIDYEIILQPATPNYFIDKLSSQKDNIIEILSLLMNSYKTQWDREWYKDQFLEAYNKLTNPKLELDIKEKEWHTLVIRNIIDLIIDTLRDGLHTKDKLLEIFLKPKVEE